MESDELRLSERPALEHPVLIAAFRGWNDGGQGATLAGGYLARLWDAERFGEIDPEGFVDFQSTRPTVSLDEGLARRIEWPENAFFHASSFSMRPNQRLTCGNAASGIAAGLAYIRCAASE